MDNVLYNSNQLDRVPLKYCEKGIIKWLQREIITCNFSIRKKELFIFMQHNLSKEKVLELTSTFLH
jgi:hypothetical protein